jgi:hypothetical protein
VADVEGESPKFEELNLPGEESAASEPSAEPPADAAPSSGAASEASFSREPQASETATEVEIAEAATEQSEADQRDDEEGEEGEQPEEERPPNKLPLYLEYAGLACIPLILLVLGYFGVVFFSTALYLIALGLIPYGIWKGRETNTVFTVILGCALAAVFTAIFCLWMEFGRYQFDVKAQEVKQRVSMVQPVQFGPASTTAAA